VEIYRGKPILYATGDFVDDYPVNAEFRNDRSFLFRVSMEGGTLERLDLVPVKLRYARVGIAVGDERELILDQMELLSAELGTAFVRHESSLVLQRG
jgi:poly-gamma-glutamate capsule biosynthesis protein CapA/YwtB (metallophosphatase superfamily)